LRIRKRSALDSMLLIWRAAAKAKLGWRTKPRHRLADPPGLTDRAGAANIGARPSAG
jgi:hypothetical protein